MVVREVQVLEDLEDVVGDLVMVGEQRDLEIHHQYHHHKEILVDLEVLVILIQHQVEVEHLHLVPHLQIILLEVREEQVLCHL